MKATGIVRRIDELGRVVIPKEIRRTLRIREGDALIYRTLECYVQRARAEKGMPYHPCKAVGLVEYAGFAKEIDPRIRCACVSCFPDVTDESCNCAWRFWMQAD